jgi:hypothetical protein
LENQYDNEERSNSGDPEASASAPIHKKLDEFITLLSESGPDNELLHELQTKFNAALRSAANSTALEPYKKKRNNIMSDEADSELGQLLFMDNLDKPAQKKLAAYQIAGMVLRVIISLLLILLGFGMIIMPAPPYFEMFTLFYLNPNDGVTIMDVISLIVAFIGVYLLISTFVKRKLNR